MRTQRSMTRAGALHSMELLFLLPIMSAVLFGVVEYSLWLSAQARYIAASREGARVAAVGGSETEIEDAVKAALPDNEKTMVQIQADIYVDASAMTPVPKATGEMVAVRVQVQACRVVPDFLRIIGLSIYGYCIQGTTVMRKE